MCIYIYIYIYIYIFLEVIIIICALSFVNNPVIFIYFMMYSNDTSF